MKHTYLLLSLLSCLIYNCQAQKTYIPDAVFRSYISSISPAAMVGDSMYINDPVISTIDTVDISNLGITSVKGIEYFDSLKSLNASWNNISSIAGLPSVPATTNLEVNLSHNPISQITTTVNYILRLVPYLNLSYCQLTGSFIYQSASVYNWRYLNVSHNNLDTISLHAMFLKGVDCSYNNLKKVQVSGNLVNNAEVICHHNLISNGASLVLSGTVYKVDCSHNLMTSLMGLTGSMRDVNCSYNSMSSIVIGGGLRTLNCSNNQLSAISALPNTLTSLSIDSNNITILPTLPASLQSLSCIGNNLLCLPTLPDTLNILSASQNYITCLPNLPTNPSFTADIAQNGGSYNVCNINTCNNYSYVKGYLFFDANGNSIYDSGDYPLSNHQVKSYPYNFIAVSDSSGHYKLPVYPGIQQYVKPTAYANTSYAPDSIQVMILNAGTDTSGFNFAYYIQSQYSDVQVSITQVMPATSGDTIALDIQVKNAGTAIESGTLALPLPSIFTYSSSNPFANTITTDSIKWNFNNLTPGSTRQFRIQVKVSANNGDQYQLFAHATILNTDSIPANNTDTLNNSIVSTYPANTKSVYPLNYNSANLAAGDYFDYTIRFQNDGNTTAQHVVIIDSLNSIFNISTLVIVASSHNYTLSITGNVLKIKYTDINLPTSSSNLPLSHGFFRFIIMPFANTVFTGSIKNKAYTYYIPAGCNCEDSVLQGSGANVAECIVPTCLKPFTISINETDIRYGGCVDTIPGKAKVRATPAGTYNYVWSTGSTIDSITNIYTQGDYYITVTNTCDARAVGTANIGIVPDTGIVVSGFSQKPKCHSQNGGVHNDGMAWVSACAYPPVSYLWSTGSTNDTVYNLVAGAYQCTVTNGLGNTKVINVTVQQPSKIDASANQYYCYDSYAQISATGGSPPYSYLWLRNIFADTLSNTSLVYYEQVVSAIYRVTDINGCFAEDIRYLVPLQYYEPEVTITPIPCTDSSIVEIQFNEFPPSEIVGNLESPGSSLGTYITPISGIMNIGGIYRLKSDEYQFTYGHIYDEFYGYSFYCNGRTIIFSVLSNNNLNLSPATSIVKPSCNGYNNGAITLSNIGGTSPYNFTWSNGATTANVQNLTAGTYSYTVTDNNHCTASNSIIVTQPLPLNAAIANASDTICYGTQTGLIQLSNTGGTPPYTYTWSNGSTTATINNATAGSYSCIVRDTKGCKDTVFASIAAYPSQTIVAEDVRNVSCYAANDGYIKLSILDGIPPLSYTWSNGVSSIINDSLTAGVYTYSVTDGNGCRVSDTSQVFQPVAVGATVETSAIPCYGDSTGTLIIHAYGGVANYTYKWNNALTDSTISGLSTGAYAYTVTDGNDCIHTNSAILNQPSSVIDSVSVLSNISCNGSADGVLKLYAVGGVGGYTYLWDSTETQTLSALAAATYHYTIADSNGCTITGIYQLSEPLPLLVSTGAPDTVCFGSSTGEINIVASGGTPTYDYGWLNSGHAENLAAGTYDYTVTDANGCSVTGTSAVYAQSEINIGIAITNETACGRLDGAAQIDTDTTLESYAWSTGDTTSAITNLQAGSYSITITDVNGCTASQSFEVSCITAIGNISMNDILIYPNPTEDVVNIRFADKGNYNIVLRDIQGKLIYSSTASPDTQIDLSSYAKGIYVLEISTDNKTMQEKLVVK